MSDIIRLTAVRKTREIEIDNPDTGKTERMVLMEMMGYDRKEYVYKSSSSIRVEDGKASGLGFLGQEIDLISRCLYEKGQDGGHVKVKPELVEKLLPSTAIGVLFNICQKMNGLGKDAEGEVKND